MLYEEKNRHLTRESYYDIAENRIKDGQQLGFDYRGKLYEKSVSALVLADDKRKSIIQKMDNMMTYLVESVKNIKKTYNYAIKRTSRDIN
jgi:hypothetical protein